MFNPDLIPLGCLDHAQPCGHPELTQTPPAYLDTLLGGLIVAAACVVAWMLWRWLWWRRLRRQTRDSR